MQQLTCREPESLKTYFHRRSLEIESALQHHLPSKLEASASIHRAMTYTVLGGGKRIRPILTLEIGEKFGASIEALLPVACTVELIHKASCIHDDLPCIDNDVLRNGKPSCHVEFGQPVAILTGDALIARAFEILSSIDDDLVPASQRLWIIKELAAALNITDGLIGGQIADMESQGKTPSYPELDFILHAKTASLIIYAAVAGAIAANVNPDDILILRDYAYCIGVSYQIADDILDIEGAETNIGKTPGKDAQAGKATYPLLYGVDAARKKAYALSSRAVSQAKRLGIDSQRLEEIAAYTIQRIT